jgi:alpha-L-arabinofuranosidase
MFRHSELFQMATFTFATSMLNTNHNEAVLNPAGLLFKPYRNHFGIIPIAVAGNSPQPAPRYPARGSQPKVNPGSDTYPLDVAAALSDDRKTLSVAVINLTESPQEPSLAFKSLELTGKGKLWRMAPKRLNATIAMGQKPGVEVEEQAVDAAPERTTVAPFSVSIYELAVK